jgi:hypothetical protein
MQKTTEEMIEIINSLIKQTSLNKTAKRIGITPASLCRAMKNKTVSDKVAQFFGYKKQVVYVKKV